MIQSRQPAANLRLDKQAKVLNALAEQMKLPLIRIARKAELARGLEQPGLDLEAIESTANHALRLLDSFLLSVNLARNQSDMELEPVSIGDVLSSSAHILSNLARQNNCELRLDLARSYEPVLAHRAGLEAALTSLGYFFIESQSVTEIQSAKPIVTLAAHRSHNGIVAGTFVQDEAYAGANQWKNSMSGPNSTNSPRISASGNGAIVYVAQSLLASMSARLRSTHYQKLNGLAATFYPSSQLTLV